MHVGQPSLDQLQIFLAIVDEGSFNAAAKRLGRAISAISYGLANLEAQLGVLLFSREGSRRPVLTDAGRALVANARSVASEVDALTARVRAMGQGLETELTVALDVMIPSAKVAAILRDFQEFFPTVDLRLHVEALGAVAALLLDGEAQLGVSGPVLVDDPALERRMVGEVAMVPVAAPGHPLARMAAIVEGASRHHLQLVLTDRSPLTRGRDFGVAGTRTWRLADLGAKHALLVEGIGWGNMPLHTVASDIAAGRLVQLALPEDPATRYGLYAQWRRDCPGGPAREWLLEALSTRLQSQ